MFKKKQLNKARTFARSSAGYFTYKKKAGGEVITRESKTVVKLVFGWILNFRAPMIQLCLHVIRSRTGSQISVGCPLCTHSLLTTAVKLIFRLDVFLSFDWFANLLLVLKWTSGFWRGWGTWSGAESNSRKTLCAQRWHKYPICSLKLTSLQ